LPKGALSQLLNSEIQGDGEESTTGACRYGEGEVWRRRGISAARTLRLGRALSAGNWARRERISREGNGHVSQVVFAQKRIRRATGQP